MSASTVDRPWDLVIFDHDGVLVDSEILAMDILADQITALGKPMTPARATSMYLGRSLDGIVDALIADGLRVDPAEFDREFHQRLFVKFTSDLVALPGIPDLVAEIHAAGIPVAIASSGSFERIDLGLRSTGLRDFFSRDSISSRDDVSRGKPFPDVFLHAASASDVDPSRCLVVEDSPHGVEAAHRAGMTVVGLSYRTPAARLAAADHVVENPADLREIVLPDSSRTDVRVESVSRGH